MKMRLLIAGLASLAMIAGLCVLPSHAVTGFDVDVKTQGNFEIWTLTPQGTVASTDSCKSPWMGSPPWVLPGSSGQAAIIVVATTGANTGWTLKSYWTNAENPVAGSGRLFTNTAPTPQPAATPAAITALGRKVQWTLVNGTGGLRTAADATLTLVFMRPSMWW